MNATTQERRCVPVHLSSVLDYVIAATGCLIIFVSFAWNIYEVFFHKSDQPQSEDSAMR